MAKPKENIDRNWLWFWWCSWQNADALRSKGGSCTWTFTSKPTTNLSLYPLGLSQRLEKCISDVTAYSNGVTLGVNIALGVGDSWYKDAWSASWGDSREWDELKETCSYKHEWSLVTQVAFKPFLHSDIAVCRLSWLSQHQNTIYRGRSCKLRAAAS